MFGDPRMPEVFWDRVIPEPNTGCWLWLGPYAGNGYGFYLVDGKRVKAHRAVFDALVGRKQEQSSYVQHSCDEKGCCNPGHLFAYRKITPQRMREYKSEWQRQAIASRPEVREKRAATNRAVYAKNPAKSIAATRRWQDNNRERHLANAKRWAAENPDIVKRIAFERRVRKYGLTVEQYEQMLDEQGNSCAICRNAFEPEQPKNVNIDHCHTSGAVRGLLCGKCNFGIGLFADAPDRLRVAADYLEKGDKS